MCISGDWNASTRNLNNYYHLIIESRESLHTLDARSATVLCFSSIKHSYVSFVTLLHAIDLTPPCLSLMYDIDMPLPLKL